MSSTEHIDPKCVRYTSRDVARLVFGKSYDWFIDNRAELTARHGFPRPVSPIGNPHWTGRALLDWIYRDQAVPNAVEGTPARAANVVDLVRSRARKAFTKA